jgi:hypothetical protein
VECPVRHTLAALKAAVAAGYRDGAALRKESD